MGEWCKVKDGPPILHPIFFAHYSILGCPKMFIHFEKSKEWGRLLCAYMDQLADSDEWSL
jgi:hypothetical protein